MFANVVENALFELCASAVSIAMDEPIFALLHVKKAEKAIDCVIDNNDAGDDPCSICPEQWCNGSHCPTFNDFLEHALYDDK